MIIALEAAGFVTKDIPYNKNRIIKALEAHSGHADFVVFGETFLQGFQSLCWDYETDRRIAVSQSDAVISEIRKAAAMNRVAVSFGYVEKAEDRLYSSQLTIGKDGKTISNYRRLSAGWKEPAADSHYCEGDGFRKFSFEGRSFVVGLCGDFWYDENCTTAAELAADIVLWPVYTDFNFSEWNNSVKTEYAVQAAKLNSTVLYVNSCCLDSKGDEIARGGAAVFRDGKIPKETAAGNESSLMVELE